MATCPVSVTNRGSWGEALPASLELVYSCIGSKGLMYESRRKR